MTIEPPKENPVTLHNRPLALEVLTRTKTFSRYPRVSEQVECLPLEVSKLFAFGYNPTINSKLQLAYRFHKPGSVSTKLAVAQLDSDWKVLSNHELSTGSTNPNVGDDDPRLFEFDGKDHISWVESMWNGRAPTGCCVKRGKFDGDIYSAAQDPLPGNDWTSWQKNWIYFEHDSSLFVIYQCHPTQKIYRLNRDGSTDVLHETEAPTWPYGKIRGGTVPLPYEGKLLRFFHSRIEHRHEPYGFRYMIGAMLLDPEPPFAVVRVSKKPVIYGSEQGRVAKQDCPLHHKVNVCFISGAIQSDNGWICSIGINDCEAALVKINPSQLNF